MTQAPPISFERASKTYRDFFLRQRIPALTGFSLDVAPGEIIGLLGPNGSGKSTALKIVTGLLRPSAGFARLFGRDPRDASARQSLGYLPEENALYPYLSAERTLLLHGRLAGLSRRDASRRAAELLETVGLRSAAKRRSGTFSKGMARRLGLAVCLMGNPRALILDEPASGLDPVATELVRELLTALKREGVAVLLSSHLLAEIEDVCDRLVVLSRGRSVATGRTAELLAIGGQYDLRVAAPDAARADAAAAALREKGFEVLAGKQPRRTLAEFYRDVVKESET